MLRFTWHRVVRDSCYLPAMKMSTIYAFSLIELLVALAILAIAGAIVVPKFVSVRQQAALTVVTQNIAQLNECYSQFRSLGGQVNPISNNPGAYRVLPFLAQQGVSNPVFDTSNPSSRQSLDSSGIVTNDGIVDSPGVGGSWTICTNTPIYSGSPGNLATDPLVAFNHGYSFADGGACLPDGFVASNPTWTIYFKCAGLFYQIDFDPNNGFSIDSNSLAPNGTGPNGNGLLPSVKL